MTAMLAADAAPPAMADAEASWTLTARVAAFQYSYARSLDEDRLEAWPEFFTERCLYKVQPRENFAQGLPLGLIYCTSRNMLRDRVRSLREANIYNIHYPLHQVTNVEVTWEPDGSIGATAALTVFQTDQEGRTNLFVVGRYRDRLVELDGRLFFAEKLIILDTFNIPNLLAVPL